MKSDFVAKFKLGEAFYRSYLNRFRLTKHTFAKFM